MIRVLSLLTLALALIAAAPARAAETTAAQTHNKEGVVLLGGVMKPRFGDLPEMVKRRTIRVLTTVELGEYFLDGAEQRGVTYDLMQRFERFVNSRLKAQKKKERIQVVMVPMAFDGILPALIAGKGDIAAARLTVTPSREKIVAFGKPFSEEESEILVTAPGVEVKTFDDLAEIGVALGPGTSYRDSIEKLNAERVAQGKKPIPVTTIDDRLQDADVLEMINAKLLQATIIDDIIARFWVRIFTGIKLHDDLTVRTNGRIAWAMRQEDVQLRALADEFVATQTARDGAALNDILATYLRSTKWATDALGGSDRVHFDETADVIERYSNSFGFDWLMIAAQGYQESRLDQTVRSHRGAIGVMQLMPTTAADPVVGIKNIESVDANIHAGVKYLSVLRRKYFDDPAMTPENKMFFSFAAYNAGPGNVNRARKKAQKMGLDPNVWFDNVEIAISSVAGQEPVRYVRNILKYYVGYSQIAAEDQARQAIKAKQ